LTNDLTIIFRVVRSHERTRSSEIHHHWQKLPLNNQSTLMPHCNNVSEEQLFSSAMDTTHPVNCCALHGYDHQNTSMQSDGTESFNGLPPPQKFNKRPDQRKPSHQQEHESITGFKRTSRQRTGELICQEESAGWLRMAPPPQKFNKLPDQRQQEHESIISFKRASRQRTGELICEEESAGWLH
jgi:hypothetical protein